MDLSGVIFVVLALVWAAYLLPKVLRHHDEVARTRSVDEVSEHARVVISAPVRNQRAPGRVRRIRSAAAERTAALTAAGRAARRRRRILAGLAAACAVTAVAAAAAVVPAWAVVVPVGLLVSFLVLCRMLVRRDQARRVTVRRVTAPVTAPDLAATEVAAGPVEELVTVAAPSAPAAPTVPAAQVAPAGSLDDTGTFRDLLVDVPAQRAGSTSSAAAAGGSLWDPLPVTLPTYVGKERAMRSVRTISLGDPGVSSSGRDAADSALVAGAASDAASEAAGGPSGEASRVVGG